MLIEIRCPNCNTEMKISSHRAKSLTDEFQCPQSGCPQTLIYIDILDKYLLSHSQRLMIDCGSDIYEIYNDFNKLKKVIEDNKYSEIFEILLKYKYKTTLFNDLYLMLSGDTKLTDDVLEMKKYFEKNKQLTLFDIKAGE